MKTERLEDDSLPGFDFVSTHKPAKFHRDEAEGDACDIDVERKEQVEIKIEINDDFNDQYDYEEEVNSYVRLDEVFDSKTESRELGKNFAIRDFRYVITDGVKVN